ncbi:FecR family protein [Nitrosomonas marina]|uniref:FecR family protein n=1 Tax=Nitrosomonas marina TaxID=917 RepID=A0A1H8C4P4_9PROT|nr:FecR domain-containing protein [Nitrosomonas marina]SEM90026.1 FecR family protein [Nitrosomonas marina]
MSKPKFVGQSQHTPKDDSLTEEAAAWFLRMQQSNRSDSEQQALEAWLSQSEAHRAEYQQYARLWHNLDYLEPKPRKKFRATVAGILVLVLICGIFQWVTQIEEIIVTAVGEHKRIVLADGTTIDINTNTKLRLALFGFTRTVTIEHGEVLFNTGSERLRAFAVNAGGGVIRDIGTEFNVLTENGETTVAVLEGAVEITLEDQDNAKAIVHSGKQLSYSGQGLSDISHTDAETATAWRKNRLIFRDTPLNEAIRQINRYHTRPVRLGEPQLHGHKVSGEFNTTDRDGLIVALKTLYGLNSSELDDMTVLYAKKQLKAGMP